VRLDWLLRFLTNKPLRLSREIAKGRLDTLSVSMPLSVPVSVSSSVFLCVVSVFDLKENLDGLFPQTKSDLRCLFVHTPLFAYF